MDVSNEESDEIKTVEGNYSEEFYMDRKDLSEFLRKLADEIEEGNEITISSKNWEIPFKFKDKVEVEIEKEYDELELELEFQELQETKEVNVE